MCVSHCFPQGQGLGCGAVLTPRLASLLADALDIPTAQLRILPVSDDITSRLRDWASVSVCRWPSHCRSISNYVAVALTDETAWWDCTNIDVMYLYIKDVGIIIPEWYNITRYNVQNNSLQSLNLDALIEYSLPMSRECWDSSGNLEHLAKRDSSERHLARQSSQYQVGQSWRSATTNSMLMLGLQLAARKTHLASVRSLGQCLRYLWQSG